MAEPSADIRLREEEMENRERYKRSIMFLASALIVLLETLLFAYIWYKFYARRDVIGRRFDRGNQVVIGLYVLMVYFFYKIYGGFKVGYLRVFEVLYSQILSVLCVNFITYLQLALIGHWKFGRNINYMLQMTGINLIVVVIWVFFMRWVYARLYPPRQMLMIYGKYSPRDLEKKIGTREDKYNICEEIHLSAGEEAIKAKILQYHAVLLGDIPAHERNLFLKFCFENNIRCYSVPKISDIMIMHADHIHLFDTSLLLFRNRGLTAEQQFVKRLMDIVVSLAGLVILSPLLLTTAIAVKSDGGPAFYKQVRLTKDGKQFEILKFRSMRVDAEKDGVARLSTGDKDDRITKVGHIIRACRLDELPQLLNILKGDLSIVGPRPERPEIAAQYCEEMPEFALRLQAKAGLTGYAQVYGKYNTTPYDKLQMDLMYIAHPSLIEDLKIMLATIKILFMPESTEGVAEGQTTAMGQETEE